MINEKMLAALNKQVNAELYASYLYLAMALDFEDKNFPGFASWMYQQSKEETIHAEKIMRFIIERGSKVELDIIDKPKNVWKDHLEAFQDAYNHEVKVTAMIHNLVKISREENDYATEVMLHWFVTEQIEEEEQTSAIVEQLKLVQNSSNGLFMLDRALATRQDVSAQ